MQSLNNATGFEQWLLTVRQTADMLAISERTLWELTNRGSLPCIRLGRAVRYDPADLRAWVQENKSPKGGTSTET